MPEESKERSLRKLAKSRRDYLAQAKMLTEDERTQEAAPSASATATRGLRRGELGAGDWHPSCLYLRPPIRRPSFSRHGNQS